MLFGLIDKKRGRLVLFLLFFICFGVAVFGQVGDKILGRSHYNAADCYEKDLSNEWIALDNVKRCDCIGDDYAIDGSGDTSDLLYMICTTGSTDFDNDKVEIDHCPGTAPDQKVDINGCSCEQNGCTECYPSTAICKENDLSKDLDSQGQCEYGYSRLQPNENNCYKYVLNENLQRCYPVLVSYAEICNCAQENIDETDPLFYCIDKNNKCEWECSNEWTKCSNNLQERECVQTCTDNTNQKTTTKTEKESQSCVELTPEQQCNGITHNDCTGGYWEFINDKFCNWVCPENTKCSKTDISGCPDNSCSDFRCDCTTNNKGEERCVLNCQPIISPCSDISSPYHQAFYRLLP
jgi:hypothetical protein